MGVPPYIHCTSTYKDFALSECVGSEAISLEPSGSLSGTPRAARTFVALSGCRSELARVIAPRIEQLARRVPHGGSVGKTEPVLQQTLPERRPEPAA